MRWAAIPGNGYGCSASPTSCGRMPWRSWTRLASGGARRRSMLVAARAESLTCLPSGPRRAGGLWAWISTRRTSREAIVNKNLLGSILVALTVTAAAAQAPTKDALIARAKSFELDTPYVPPPGDPLTPHAAGFAKGLCSAIFMTGLAAGFAAGNVGVFTSPFGG